MNTKKKGDRGVGRAICAFTECGWTVCIPITDSQDYDLVVDIPIRGLQRVQVKYTAMRNRCGNHVVQLGIRGGTRGGIWKRPEELVFDLLFIATDVGTDWLIPRESVKSSISVGESTRNKVYQFVPGKAAASASMTVNHVRDCASGAAPHWHTTHH